ncbi:hypothetical protein [Cellulomonas soli]|uniref:WXG100 family type VII secretion target n=1 Tax=Cellulomonas soli TaxID=931535 RepID=A0A512PF28_9CELL|nr:hypothetical protein [Cellulomonas soli]NYI59399.1 uncharacterized protein YukE [Cellulomonas soli]GEP69810.1 hypothetical protein CSO01_25250 [Cellulomonas soli]
MAADTSMEVGAQALAASRVRQAVPEVLEAIDALSRAVGAAIPGFRGASAAALTEALDAWFTAAADLPPCLHAWADALVAVDTTAAEAEARQADTFLALTGRLGGLPQ